VYLNSFIPVNGQTGNTPQEKQAVIPLAERIGHTDKSKAMWENASSGHPELCYMQTLLGRGAIYRIKTLCTMDL